MSVRNMADFFALYDKILHYYRRGEYTIALDLLQILPRQTEIPAAKRWHYHQARALCYFWQGNVSASLSEWEAVVANPGDMPLTSRQENYSNYLMYNHYIDGIRDEDMREKHFKYQDFFVNVPMFSHSRANHRHEKLRIGYLSPDIVDHIVTNFTVQLFALHDRQNFEVRLYNIGERTNEVTDWLYGMVSGGENIAGLSPEAAARKIYEDEIDILMDLSGHCAGGKTLQIAAYKPAPVQICGIGYFDTTGLLAMDYVLGDVYCDPSGQDAFFREKLIRLPHSHLCYTPSERFAEEFPHYEIGEQIVFGSFNNFAKITDEVLLAWREILERVPHSRLLLKNVHPIVDTMFYMKKRLRKHAFPMERVELRPGSPDYIKDYADVDIILDTYPYTGGGTTCEALYIGIPIINRRGSRHGSRFSYSLLANVGLEELSVTNWEDYIAKAVALAYDAPLLSKLRQKIPIMMKNSPIMDGENYVKEVENAYKQIWQKWYQG